MYVLQMLLGNSVFDWLWCTAICNMLLLLIGLLLLCVLHKPPSVHKVQQTQCSEYSAYWVDVYSSWSSRSFPKPHRVFLVPSPVSQESFVKICLHVFWVIKVSKVAYSQMARWVDNRNIAYIAYITCSLEVMFQCAIYCIAEKSSGRLTWNFSV